MTTRKAIWHAFRCFGLNCVRTSEVLQKSIMADDAPAAEAAEAAAPELTFATPDDNQKSDLAHSLAVAILYDTKKDVTAANIESVLKAAGVSPSGTFTGPFEQALNGKEIAPLFELKPGSGGGGGGGGGGAAAEVEKEEEAKEEEKEEEAAVGNLFGGDDDADDAWQ